MTKLTENAFRDVNIAFANELSVICDHLSVNVWDLISLANLHPRVNILNPGPGVGGHCIAVDPWFIVDSAPKLARLIRTARQVNDEKPNWVVEKILQEINNIQGRKDAPVKIACLGLAFKANIDDLRESPAVEIVKHLLAKNLAFHLLLVEPYIERLPVELQGNPIAALVDSETALRDADIVVLLVDHSHFKSITAEQLTEKKVIDTRGFWR